MYEQRPLKRRSAREVREVPIPPELIATLRVHVDTFGLAADGQLFPGAGGGPIAASVYTGVWKRARAVALLPDSPLAPSTLRLRHAAVSSWLAGGVDPTCRTHSASADHGLRQGAPRPRRREQPQDRGPAWLASEVV